MWSVLLLFPALIQFGSCTLWKKGIVHYAINPKDYDFNSQDIITSTFSKIEKEICVKFFNTPLNYTASEEDKILYISNPDKRKICTPGTYNYSGSIVDLVVGYKCLNERDIVRLLVDMLKSSIEPNVKPVNSFDLVKKFQDSELNPNSSSLLSPADKDYINTKYHAECGALTHRPPPHNRRVGSEEEDSILSVENLVFYHHKIWPLGIVMYGIHNELRDTALHSQLKYAMTAIELTTCVVFQDAIGDDDVLIPKNLLWFSNEGADIPELGFKEGRQVVNLYNVIHGAPGHIAHTFNLLLRILGLTMMSNRFDRDNHVVVNWKKVKRGYEHYLEKTPHQAWVKAIPYDFDSVTHAPANYLCEDCKLGGQTVQPMQDHLWQRTLSMGHVTKLSPSDILLVKALYGNECQARFAN